MRDWPDAAPIIVVVASAIYLVGFSLFRQNWSTLLIFVPIFVVAAWLGRLRSFAVTWVPIAVFLDAFARLRGVADNTGIPIHHSAALEAERRLFFGTVPTVWLQNRLTIPKHFRWYDYAATALHWSHFVMPITILFILWLQYPGLLPPLPDRLRRRDDDRARHLLHLPLLTAVDGRAGGISCRISPARWWMSRCS